MGRAYASAVPDRKPRRFAAGERETLCELWQYHRESLVRKLDGVSEQDARRRFVPSDTTLLWLVKHAAGAETLWVLSTFAGEPVGARDDAPGPDDTVESIAALYRQTWLRVDAVVAAADLDAECVVGGGSDVVNLRWIVTHLLEETARHAGHADIVRELIDGETGR